jgi:hypothetical protein
MKAFGRLTIHRHSVPDAPDTFTAQLEGSPIILISQEFMDDATPALLQRDEDELTIIQYRFKIISRTPRGDYVAERIYE